MRIYYYFSKKIDLLPQFLLVRVWGIPRPSSDLYVERGDLAEIVEILVSIKKNINHVPQSKHRLFKGTPSNFLKLRSSKLKVLSILHTRTYTLHTNEFIQRHPPLPHTQFVQQCRKYLINIIYRYDTTFDNTNHFDYNEFKQLRN